MDNVKSKVPSPHEEYLATVDRLEPDITMIDAGAYYASAAISLKRIADSLEYIINKLKEEDDKK